MKITNAMLRGACRKQRKLFRETWPDGAAVTKANARKAAKLGLDCDWLANKLLSAPLDDEYSAKRKPLNDEYNLARWLALVPLLLRALAAQEEVGRG